MSEELSFKNDRDPAIQFKSQLDKILYTPVTVDNINRFTDDALEELIKLNEAVVSQYQSDIEEADSYSGTELEDQAYTQYGLENLNTVLERIMAVRDQIVNITVQVSAALEQTNIVITPPDPSGLVLESSGSGTYEAPKKLDRLITLAFILERDFDIDPSSVRYKQGYTTDAMLRQEPYVRVEIEDIDRIVYVCDEEGNASYVFDAEVLEQLGISTPELDNMSKNQRNALLRITPTAGKRIIQTPEWRSVMATALREPFAETKDKEPITHSPISEFAERTKFLPLDEFTAAVREAYEEAGAPGNVQEWYRNEYKKHHGWPASPYWKYKDAGWNGFPTLLGKEVAERLDFNDFVTAVKTAYVEAGSPDLISDWYQETRTKHAGWPSNPHRTYGAEWEGYPALVGKEVVKLLEFSEFQNEVQVAYETAGSPNNVPDWYQSVQKRHKGWPVSPQNSYKDKGWKGYPALVGKEVVKLLEFSEFQNEVQAAYDTTDRDVDNLGKWYQQEYKKHTGWPVSPQLTYKSKGWKGYPALIGRETIEPLEFSDFINQVRSEYKKAGSPINVVKWYRREYKNHLGWPSSPHETYHQSGWAGYTELSAKEIIKFLEYSEFADEVRAKYATAGFPADVLRWYKQEYKKNTGWPGQPNSYYKNNGWAGYPSLVEKKIPAYLDFIDFTSSVRTAYHKAGSPPNIRDWYRVEIEKYLTWPSHPQEVYANNGWKGYAELVGKEVMEFLVFNDFVTAVRLAYEAAGSPGSVQSWYKQKYKTQPGWPSNPGRTYLGKGWKSYPELVGKK